jgi:hypothetical protein
MAWVVALTLEGLELAIVIAGKLGASGPIGLASGHFRFGCCSVVGHIIS